MPYITVESGALSDEQKEELIKRLTEVSSEIMKVPQEFFVTTIKEHYFTRLRNKALSPKQ